LEEEEEESKEIEHTKPKKGLGIQKYLPTLLGTKFYIKASFLPHETTPYELDLVIDFGCQLNVIIKIVIPCF